jgi:hypothetical protein
MFFFEMLLSRCRQADMRPTILLPVVVDPGNKFFADVNVTSDKLIASVMDWMKIRNKGVIADVNDTGW